MKRSRAILVVMLAAMAALAVVPAPSASGATESWVRQYVKERIGDTRKLSQGAKMWLKGPQAPSEEPFAPNPSVSLGSNQDVNDIAKDFLGGQSETAIAASGDNLVAAWNDATGFLGNDSTKLTSSLTGVAVSTDAGASWTDLTGLPNANRNMQWSGDPTVVAIDDTHFVVGSLYWPSWWASCRRGPIWGTIAATVATIEGDGSVTFSAPIRMTLTGDLCKRHTAVPKAFIDKEFLSFDPTTRTLAVSYTRFFLSWSRSGLGQIEVTRATVPADPSTLSTADFSKVVVWGEEDWCKYSSESAQCGALNQGSYPAVAPNGDVYVAWERNILTNVYGNGDPYIYIHAAYVPAGATAPTVGGKADPVVVTKSQDNSNRDGGVRSLDNVFIAGYSRGFGNDFPRVAYNPVADELVVVWNDASAHPLGDVWIRAADPGLADLGPIRRVNDLEDWTLHFMPAVSVATDGTIRVSWYDRRNGGPDSTETDYYGEIRPSATTNGADFRISTGSTDWWGTSTVINPNFGDYTDNATTGTTTYWFWADGRLGVPQPFVDKTS